MRALLLAVALLTMGLGSAPLQLSRPYPWRAIGRSDVRLTVRVERDDRNRALVLVIDGPKYARIDIPLNDSPDYQDSRLFQRWFPGVPPGAYEVTAIVQRAGAPDLRASSSFCLIGPNEECEP